jgi:hypothetical protein
MMEGYDCCALGVTRQESPCSCERGHALLHEFQEQVKVSYTHAKQWLNDRVAEAHAAQAIADKAVAQRKQAQAEAAHAAKWAKRYAAGYVECVRCGGTGSYGHWGECYRCRGTQVDPKRKAKKGGKA